jgi:hypothetical protein
MRRGDYLTEAIGVLFIQAIVDGGYYPVVLFLCHVRTVTVDSRMPDR